MIGLSILVDVVTLTDLKPVAFKSLDQAGLLFLGIKLEGCVPGLGRKALYPVPGRLPSTRAHHHHVVGLKAYTGDAPVIVSVTRVGAFIDLSSYILQGDPVVGGAVVVDHHVGADSEAIGIQRLNEIRARIRAFGQRLGNVTGHRNCPDHGRLRILSFDEYDIRGKTDSGNGSGIVSVTRVGTGVELRA